jgi:hypothetical protein
MVDGEPCVLVTASAGGGVILIRRRDQEILFTLPLVNAHSAEILPDGWIAVAGSLGSDRIVLHRIDAGPLAEGSRGDHPFPWAHGLVFEPARSVLWACGESMLRAYAWRNGACTCLREIVLPSDQAHDLIPDPFAGGLIVTTDDHVWRVDPQTGAVTPFTPLAGAPHVKGLSVDARSGDLAYVQAHGTTWWSEYVTVLSAGVSRDFHFPGLRLYKARWDQSCRLESAHPSVQPAGR